MENHTDQIDAYINNSLSESERLAFENKLKRDPEFYQQYQEQLILLEGIKRVGLKTEINSAKKSYLLRKWLRYFGVSLGLLLSVLALFYVVYKTAIPTQIPDNSKMQSLEKEHLSTRDSVLKKYTVVVKKDTAIRNQEKTKLFKVPYYEERLVITYSAKLTLREFKQKYPAYKQVEPRNDSIIIHEPILNNSIEIESYPTGITARNRVQNKDSLTIKNDVEANNVQKHSRENGLKAFYKAVKKLPETIEFNTEKDFSITLKEGTSLNIPAKSFIGAKTGRLARGVVSLEVTEFYKLSDMLLANLSTTSNGELLETGGMLYIDANKKGEQLTLKPGKTMEVVFNKSGKKNMQLFSGTMHTTGINWNLQNTEGDSVNRTIVNSQMEIIEEHVVVDFRVMDEPPRFSGCENQPKKESRDCTIRAIESQFQREYNLSVADGLGLTGKQKMRCFFKIDSQGRIGELSVRASNRVLGLEAIRVLEALPKFIPGKQRGKLVSTHLYLPLEIVFPGKTVPADSSVVVKSDSKFVATLEARIDSMAVVKGALSEVSHRDIERYAFATSTLGWLNSDKFVSSKKPRVKFKFKLNDAEGTQMKMVFKSMSSILSGKKQGEIFDFGQVPEDEAIILIAIKKTKDKLYLATKETKTRANPNVNLEFVELSMHELKEALKALDADFH